MAIRPATRRRRPFTRVTAKSILPLEVPTRYVNPSTQQWNLTIQQSLGQGWVLEAGYVGTKGTHLRETRDANQAIDARLNPVTLTAADGVSYTINQNTAANVNARALYPGLGVSGFQIFANDANSVYNSSTGDPLAPICAWAAFPGGLHLLESDR